MTAMLLLIAQTVAGIHFVEVPVVRRSHPASGGRWEEKVTAIRSTDPADTAFNRVMHDLALETARASFGDDGGKPVRETSADALETDEGLIAASPDLISVSIGASAMWQGGAHPQPQGGRQYIWSRRLKRQLHQDDVLAVSPDLALRLLAFKLFDNQDGLDGLDAAKGLPLDWDDATIGPDGITWSLGRMNSVAICREAARRSVGRT